MPSHSSGAEAVRDAVVGAEEINIDPPDISVLRLHRRPPPALPINVFGPRLRQWVLDAAAAAACPPDYVAAPLLTSTSTVIGNARWAEAAPGWREPPHVWAASVGDSGEGKSPGADLIYRHVLPPIEARMARDFPECLRKHLTQLELNKAKREAWERDVKNAHDKNLPPPLAPEISDETAPVAPRLVQNDVTIEKVALLLASAAPKGLLIVRDELAGWLLGMNAYNEGARAFWIEAYGGRPYRVDRVKHPQPISIPHLSVGLHGGIQPSRLAGVMREADDGLLARFAWFWPDPIPFKLATAAPSVDFAVGVFERLQSLEMLPGRAVGMAPEPLVIPLDEAAREDMERFAREMQERQETAGGLFRSALAKARGLALRLSLVLEFLWWAAGDAAPAPTRISKAAFLAAATLVGEYLMPMAERVYGDAAATTLTRNTATLARWIVKKRPSEVHVRHLQREERLPGLVEASEIRDACSALVEAGWLLQPRPTGAAGRPRAAYIVRPELWEVIR